ncbi:MAG: response regulator [Planctomycetota bacterium]
MSQRTLRKSVVLVVQSKPHQLRKWISEELAVPAIAKSLEEARHILQHTIPDTVFVDDRLTDGTGVQLLQDMQKSKHHKDTPVVLVAESEDLRVLERAIMSGIYACVKLPLDENECKRMLRKALTGRTGRVEY